MGDCLGHLPLPIFNWFGGEAPVPSKCRRCRMSSGGGDSWPLLRTDSQEELFPTTTTTTVKWTKKGKEQGMGDDLRGRFSRWHNRDRGFWGGESNGNPGQGGSGESDRFLEKCSSSRICTTNRAEAMDLCTCDDDTSEVESDSTVESTQAQSCSYFSTTGDESEYFWDAETSGGEKEIDQPGWNKASPSTLVRGMKSCEVLQKMSSRSLSSSLLAGAEAACNKKETGNDAAILPLLNSPEDKNQKHHYATEESDQESSHLIHFQGSF